MPKVTIDVEVSEMVNALQAAADRRGVGIEELPDSLNLDVEGRIDQDEIAELACDAGYVHEDDALDGLDPLARDLADGLRCLVEGDRAMAAVLLTRAFSEWPDASRIVEEVLLSRTHNDRRQGALALAA